MIFLIGGPPRCGKTTLAKKLARRLRTGWVSIDVLEMIADAYTPSDKHAKLFPKTLLCENTGWKNDALYNRRTKREILSAYIRQGFASKKAINQFVSYMIEYGHDFILEGYQLHPKLIRELHAKYPGHIRSALMTKTDVEKIQEGFKRNRLTPDWTTEKTTDPDVLPKIADMLSGFGKWVEAEGKEYKIACFHTDTDYRKGLTSALHYLSKEY